jgi:cellulose synthase operon protein C
MNLGRAFVLAGADWVIGADGKVDDELARALGEALHLHSGRAGNPDHFDGPAALRQAQLELRAADPDGRWRVFRAIGP